MNNHPIGIIDSGIGGLSIAQAIWQQLPQESTIFLADHQFLPYSGRSIQTINQRLVKIINYLVNQNCKAIVIACNTITTSSIDFLRSIYKLPFIGTVPAIKPAIEKNLKENILVLATQATANSQYHKNMIKALDKQGKITAIACPGLAEAIETGNQVKIIKEFKTHLTKVNQNYSAVVLGCTHYILIKDIIKKTLPPHTLIIEPSQAIAKQTQAILKKNNLFTNAKNSKHVFLTTKNSNKVSKTASKFLHKSIIFTKCNL